MIIVPLEVEHIPLEFHLGVVYFLLGCSCLWVSLKLITLVVSSSGRVVLSPFLEAHPAKVPATYSADHVIASLILFNGLPAILVGALFSIGDDPSDILTFTGILKLPLLLHVTVSWPVQLFTALEAVRVSTNAVHAITSKRIRDTFCGVVTIRNGAPPDSLVIVGEGLAVPSQVSFPHVVVTFEDVEVHGVSNHHVALVLLALGRDAAWPLVDLFSEVLFPASTAELMATRHG